MAGRFFPHYAGPAERFRRYAPGIHELGVDLRVITVRRSDTEPEIDRVDDILVERRSVSTDNDPTRTNTSRLLPSVIRGFHQTGKWPDVLQLLTPPMKTDIPYLWQARAQGLPLLLVSTMMLREIRNLRDRLYNWWIFSPFDRIVTSSSVMTDQLARLALFSSRIETIPNGVDCQRFRPARSPDKRAELRQKFGFEPDDEIIIYVGSITPRKGVDILVSAWQEIIRQHPHARLLLVGPHHRPSGESLSNDTINAFCDEVDVLVSQSLAPWRVTFTGEVSNVEEYLQLADIFVFPSMFEGMPNVVPEAMAVGLPCVITPFEGLPTEFGRPGYEYVLTERKRSGIADAVMNLLRNPTLRSTVSQNALAWIRRNMDVKVSLERYEKVYRQLARRRF